MEVNNNIAYVAGRQSGLHIVDVSNPASPVLLSTFDTSGYATSLAVSGNKLALSSRRRVFIFLMLVFLQNRNCYSI